MRCQTIIAAAVGAAAVAEAVLSIPPKLRKEYKIEPMGWTGVIEDGGPEVSFNGTIEEVTRQIQATKRDFTWESLRRDHGNFTTPLQKRDKAGVLCGVGGEGVGTQGALTSNVEDSKAKISNMVGNCTVAAGPRTCSVITCARYTAVWLCNDNTNPIAPPCSSLASYVDDIVQKCGQGYHHGYKVCHGQEFDSSNFNVIVGWKAECQLF